jgi:hypothetical protein
VIFVSHNMGAVLDLCTHGALLEQGRLLQTGSIEEVVAAYVQRSQDGSEGRFRRVPFDAAAQVLTAATLSNAAGVETDLFEYGSPLRIRLETNPGVEREFGLELKIKNSLRHPVAYAASWIAGEGNFQPGDPIEIEIPSLPLAEDTYFIDFGCRLPRRRHVDNWWDSVSFRVVNARPGLSPVSVLGSDQLGAIVLEDATFS